MKNKVAYSQIQTYNQSKQKISEQQVQTLPNTDLLSTTLSKIKIVNCNNLQLCDKPYPTLIKDIAHIYFPNLTYLNLRYSQISNLQSLEFLNCPKLICLELHNNSIHNLNPITRNQVIKNLRTLTFYKNPIKSPWKIEKQHLYELKQLEFDDKKYSPPTVQHLSFLFKIPSKQITKIYVRSNQRIQQKRILKMIKQMSKIPHQKK